jgi:hypothetical protein
MTSESKLCSTIKFGDGIALSLQDRGLIKSAQHRLHEFCKPVDTYTTLVSGTVGTVGTVGRINKFPGVLPVALLRKYLPLLCPKGIVENRCDGDHTVFLLPNGKRRKSILPSAASSTSTKKFHYMVSYKADGERYKYALYNRDRHRAVDPQQLVCSRMMVPLLIKMEVTDDDLYNGTAMDGELVKDNCGATGGTDAVILPPSHAASADGKSSGLEHTLLVFDLEVSCGNKVGDRTYEERMKLAETLLTNIRPSSKTNESPFKIKIKPSAFVEDIELYLLKLGAIRPLTATVSEHKHLAALADKSREESTPMYEWCGDEVSPPVDGLYFIPNELPVEYCTTYNQFKWKEPKNCTNEYQLRLRGEVPSPKPLASTDSPAVFSDSVTHGSEGMRQGGATSSPQVELLVECDDGPRVAMVQSLEVTFGPGDNAPTTTIEAKCKQNAKAILLGEMSGEHIGMESGAPLIVSCRRNNDLSWTVVGIRIDKTKANYYKTIEETNQALDENITINDIIAVIRGQ